MNLSDIVRVYDAEDLGWETRKDDVRYLAELSALTKEEKMTPKTEAGEPQEKASFPAGARYVAMRKILGEAEKKAMDVVKKWEVFNKEWDKAYEEYGKAKELLEEDERRLVSSRIRFRDSKRDVNRADSRTSWLSSDVEQEISSFSAIICEAKEFVSDFTLKVAIYHRDALKDLIFPKK